MKNLFCLVLLILCFAVPAHAESVISADDDDITIMLEEALAQVEFDYSCVTLNREKGMFIVDVAIDGLTENLLSLKRDGYNETFEAWVGLKDVMLSMHGSIVELFKAVHREDLKLIFNVVNDDVYIREDYSTVSYNPLLSIGIYGIVAVDVME